MSNGAEDATPAEESEAPAAEGDVEKLKREMIQLREELEKQVAAAREYLDAAKRIQAEFDNHKKRVQKEREEFVRVANQKLIGELLPILDDLERALEASCDLAGLQEGVLRIYGNLKSLLRSHGVEEVPSDGRFNPEIHEAISVGEGEEGKILEVYQKGYFLGPRVLRHPKVRVGKREQEGGTNVKDNRN